MKFPDILTVITDQIEKGTYYIVEVKTPIDPDDTLYADNIEVKLIDDTSLGSAWIGWGIVRMLAESGKQIAIMMPKGGKAMYPKDVEDV